MFIDVVGYSKLLVNEQSGLLRELNEVVSGTHEFREAEAEGKLIRLPTGDGMALVFRTDPEAPAQCALEITRALKEHPRIALRMGIHSGPVNEVVDVNQRQNIAGAGINMAQRVTKQALSKPFTIYTRWRRALGRSAIWRYYALVVTADGADLNELLVKNGLARIYGTRTLLPDGRDSREYLAHLHELENEAKAAKRGAWVKVPMPSNQPTRTTTSRTSSRWLNVYVPRRIF